MISFTPTDEQTMLVDTVQRYASEVIRDLAHHADESSQSLPDVVNKGWALGILPGLIPEEYGGYADEQIAVTGVLALEELAWGDLAFAMDIMAPSLFALPVLHAGTEDQKKTYLPAFCDLERPIATAALIEPQPLFNAWKPATVSTRKNGKILLSGSKAYVPYAAEAQRMIVYASDSETGRVNGFIVEKDVEGLTIGSVEKLMGLRALPMYRVNLADVSVAEDSCLGGNEGTDYELILSRSRIALGALAVGVARASFEYARDYAKERVQFGVPIATKQAIAFKLAEMAIEIDGARLMVWEAAWKADRGQSSLQEATQINQHINEMVLFATDSSLQILGGHGYIREHPVERWLRNARGFTTFDGLAIV